VPYYKELNEDGGKRASFNDAGNLSEPFHVWSVDNDGDINQMIQLSRKEAREVALFILEKLTSCDD
jgi:hypothetical protein